MPKRGVRDLAKEQRWRGVIADWQKTGLSAAEYCRHHGITYTQFTDWLKRLRKRDAERSQVSSYRQKLAERAKRIAEQVATERARSVEFAKAELVDRVEPEVAASHSESIGGVLEIVFPSGTTLRVPAGWPAASLASVIAALEER